MSTTVGQHGVTAFTNPSNGDALDADVVKGNDNTLREAYVDHDSDPGIHLQSSSTASRPAAGVAGRKWMTYDTTTPRIYYDDGTTWREIAYLTLNPGATTFSGNVAVSGGASGYALTVSGGGSGSMNVSGTANFATIVSQVASISTQNVVYGTEVSPAQTITQRLGFGNQTTATDWTGVITKSLRPVQNIRLTGNATVTLSNDLSYTATPSGVFVCVIRQDSVGGRTLAFSNVLFPGGTTPTQTTTADKADLWMFVALDSSLFYGVRLGANF